MTKWSLSCGLFVLLLASGNAWADPVTVRFAATVEQSEGPIDELLGDPVGVGDVLHGTFQYDPLVSPWLTWPEFHIYDDPKGSLRLDSLLSLSRLGLTVFDSGIDRFEVEGLGWDFSPAFPLMRMTLTFDDEGPTQGTTLTGFQLPGSAATLAAFPNKRFVIAAVDNSPHVVIWTTGSVTLLDIPPPIPEPASIVLLGSGILGLLLRVPQRREWQLRPEPRDRGRIAV